jgi:hypothetical protein
VGLYVICDHHDGRAIGVCMDPEIYF